METKEITSDFFSLSAMAQRILLATPKHQRGWPSRVKVVLSIGLISGYVGLAMYDTLRPPVENIASKIVDIHIL